MVIVPLNMVISNQLCDLPIQNGAKIHFRNDCRRGEDLHDFAGESAQVAVCAQLLQLAKEGAGGRPEPRGAGGKVEGFPWIFPDFHIFQRHFGLNFIENHIFFRSEQP